MKRFETGQLYEALAYAAEGGQALHTHPFTGGHRFFKRYGQAGHLFDQNKQRLIETALRLGVRVIKVEYENQPRQHIDLCARPLTRAIAESEK